MVADRPSISAANAGIARKREKRRMETPKNIFIIILLPPATDTNNISFISEESVKFKIVVSQSLSVYR